MSKPADRLPSGPPPPAAEGLESDPEPSSKDGAPSGEPRRRHRKIEVVLSDEQIDQILMLATLGSSPSQIAAGLRLQLEAVRDVILTPGRRGTCPVCRLVVRVADSNRMRWHSRRPGETRRCAGTGRNVRKQQGESR